MRKQTSSLVLGLLATLALAQPLQAIADSKGGKSSSSRSESRSSGGDSHSGRSESRSSSSESHSSGRSEYSSRRESRSDDSDSGSERSAKNERHDERYGHERGEGRHDWDAGRHQQGMLQGTNRPAMTPEAAALLSQARQASFEYRTTGSADSLAALQSLQASLTSLGFTRTPGRNIAGTSPVTPGTPVAVTPTPVAPDTTTQALATNITGTPVAAGTSGVIAQ